MRAWVVRSLGYLCSPLSRVTTGVGRVRTLVLLGFVVVVAAGCANGTYPLDVFYEMHYQQSYQSHEPPRLSAPRDAVPVTGRETFGTENPIRGERVEEGARLFATNCGFCHGVDGKGTGQVLLTMKDTYGYGIGDRPYTITPDLTDDFVKDQADVGLFGWITNGVTVMPSFDRLLTVEERWLLINYIRTLPD